MSAYKTQMLKTTVEGAIESFYATISDLKDQISEVVDNAPNQELPRIQTLQESVDALEIDDPGFDYPEGTSDIEIDVPQSLKKGKKLGTESRATRRDNAVAYARSAIEALNEWADGQETELEAMTDDQVREEAKTENVSDGALALTLKMRAERGDQIDAVRGYCDKIEEHINQVEEAEFPGMYSS